MIKGIYQSGKYLTVSGGNPPPSLYIQPNYSGSTSGPAGFTGQVRYSSANQCMEVFDGSTWQMIQTTMASVGLNADAERTIEWAQKKMLEELDLMDRMNRHPGLRQAYEQFRIMDALTLQEEKHGQEA
jgi:hypothetical protein